MRAFRPTLPLLLLASTACADTLESNSKVDAVSVFPTAALVSRVATVHVPKGAHFLGVRGLPRDLDVDTIRVSAKGAGALRIGAVDETPIPTPTAPKQDPDVARRLEALKAEKEAVAAALDRVSMKQAFLLKYAKSNVETDTEISNPAKWAERWTPIETGLAEADKSRIELGAKATSIDEEIASLDAPNSPPPSTPPRQRERDIQVAIEADEDIASATFTISYKVGSAGWSPVYDVELSTPEDGKPSLSLSRRATVRQSTDEDWTDVVLTVSTANPSLSPSMPAIATTIAKSFDATSERVGGVMFNEVSQALREPDVRIASRAPAVALAPAMMPRDAEAVESRVDSRGWNVLFVIPGRVTVASGSSAKTVLLTRESTTPDISVATFPEAEAAAYLEAKFKPKGDAPLFAGPVNLNHDGVPAGRGRLTFTPPGDSLTLDFGPDEGIKVSRITVHDDKSVPGLLSMSGATTLTREFLTSLKNLHKDRRAVVVYDRIPVSEQKDVEVKRMFPPDAGEKDTPDKRGVTERIVDLAPGEQKSLKGGYTISFPYKQVLDIR